MPLTIETLHATLTRMMEEEPAMADYEVMVGISPQIGRNIAAVIADTGNKILYLETFFDPDRLDKISKRLVAEDKDKKLH